MPLPATGGTIHVHKTRQPSLDKQATPAGGVAIGGRRGLAEPHGEGANRRHCVAAASGRVKCLPAWCSMFHIRGCERAIGSGSGRAAAASPPSRPKRVSWQTSDLASMGCRATVSRPRRRSNARAGGARGATHAWLRCCCGRRVHAKIEDLEADRDQLQVFQGPARHPSFSVL